MLPNKTYGYGVLSGFLHNKCTIQKMQTIITRLIVNLAGYLCTHYSPVIFTWKWHFLNKRVYDNIKTKAKVLTSYYYYYSLWS